MSKQTTTQKRKRVTNKGGQCLTNEAAMNLLEAVAKRQKLIDSEIKKRDREETRKLKFETVLNLPASRASCGPRWR